MSKIYTDIRVRGDNILYRGRDEKNKRVMKKVPYKPYLFLPSKTGQTEYKTLEGKLVDKIDFDSIREARDFLKLYKDVDGMTIYGLDRFAYTFLNDYHPKEIKYHRTRMNIASIDIENAKTAEGEWPNTTTTQGEVTAISIIKNFDTVIVLGLDDFDSAKVSEEEKKLLPFDPSKIIYIKCATETILLKKFLDIWNQLDIDVVTGWNIKIYDIPYLFNRIKLILGEEAARKMSPWEFVDVSEERDDKGRTNLVCELHGIVILDYIELFRKFTYAQQEQWTLEHIANQVLGVGKLDYSAFLDLEDFRRRDHQHFILYNIIDTARVNQIDQKMNLIDQAMTLAYMARSLIPDVFGSVKIWDAYIHALLMETKRVMPPQVFNGKSEKFEGAYVKQPRVGRRKWVVSVDFEALYPKLMVEFNLSPETYKGKLGRYYTVQQLLKGELGEDVREYLKENNLSLAANMTLWDNDREGLFPEIVQKVLGERKIAKKQMLICKQEKEKCSDSSRIQELEYEITRLNNLQMALKILANSLYGCVGTPYFRFYTTDFAEAITNSGQLACQWTEMKLNDYLNKLFKTEGVEYVIYADTDSNYITLEPIVEKMFAGKDVTDEQVIKFMDKLVSEKIEPYIEETLTELGDYLNAYKKALVMKREALATSAIWIGKKTYMLNILNNEGVQYAEPQLKMLGIAAVKTSTPMWARDKLKTAIKMMLSGKETDLHEFIDICRQEWNQLPFEKIATPTGCNNIKKYADSKEIWGYKTPGHVKGALIYNHLLRHHDLLKKYQPIMDGDKVKMVKLRMPNPSQFDVISTPGFLPSEFNLEKFVDYEAQFQKSFIEPIQKIVDAIGWATEARSSLESFFG